MAQEIIDDLDDMTPEKIAQEVSLFEEAPEFQSQLDPAEYAIDYYKDAYKKLTDSYSFIPKSDLDFNIITTIFNSNIAYLLKNEEEKPLKEVAEIHYDCVLGAAIILNQYIDGKPFEHIYEDIGTPEI